MAHNIVIILSKIDEMGRLAQVLASQAARVNTLLANNVAQDETACHDALENLETQLNCTPLAELEQRFAALKAAV